MSPSTLVVLDRVALVAAWSEIEGGSAWLHPLKEKFMRRQPALLRFLLKHFTGTFGVDLGIGQKVAFSIWLAFARQGRTPIYIDAWLLECGLRKQSRACENKIPQPDDPMRDYLTHRLASLISPPWNSPGFGEHYLPEFRAVADSLCEAAA